MRAVDTNVIVRLFARDDAHQAELADRYIEQGAWVSQIALVEAVWVMASVYRRTPDALISHIEMLLSHKDLTVQDPDVVVAALDLFRARPALGFTDCMVLEIGRKFGHLPLGTFDRKLARVEGTQKL